MPSTHCYCYPYIHIGSYAVCIIIHVYSCKHAWVVASSTVLEIVVGPRTFSAKIADCLNNFGFGLTKCPGKSNMILELCM